MTTSWITQLSMEPVLIGVGVDNGAVTHRLISAGGSFTVNLWDAENTKVFVKFSKPAQGDTEQLNGWSIVEAATGAPVLVDAVAWLDCALRHSFDLGTHTLFVGEVVAAGDQPRRRARRLDDRHPDEVRRRQAPLTTPAARAWAQHAAGGEADRSGRDSGGAPPKRHAVAMRIRRVRSRGRRERDRWAAVPAPDRHGHDVTLVARGPHARAINADGMTINDPNGTDIVRVPAVERIDDVPLDDGDAVILSMKTQGTPAALDALAAHAPRGSPWSPRRTESRTNASRCAGSRTSPGSA